MNRFWRDKKNPSLYAHSPRNPGACGKADEEKRETHDADARDADDAKDARTETVLTMTRDKSNAKPAERVSLDIMKGVCEG